MNELTFSADLSLEISSPDYEPFPFPEMQSSKCM